MPVSVGMFGTYHRGGSSLVEAKDKARQRERMDEAIAS